MNTSISLILIMAIIVSACATPMMDQELTHTMKHNDDITFTQQLIESKASCDELNDEELERIGEYYMEQMHPGKTHDEMDAAMGGHGSERLREVHINMARQYYCEEEVDGELCGVGSCPAMEAMNNMMGGNMMQRGMMMQEGFLPGQERDLQSIQNVKSSTIVSIADGETFTLTADMVKKTIDGKEYVMYGYNGQIPGVAFRVQKNSTIYVDFTNNIDWETTVHWHGLRHDIKDDGVPGVSQDPVKPGESFQYKLYFPDEGIYWYHPHVREDIQQDNGLAGNMLVDAAPEYWNPVNREELLVLDDVLIENEKIVPFGKEHANYALMGRFGNTMLTNGEEEYELSVQKGEVVRFYITNVANVRPYNLSIAGAIMKLVGGDLGAYEQETFVDSVVIAPAERYIVEAYFEKEGTYNLMNINPHETYILGTITVDEIATTQDHSSVFSKTKAHTDIIQDIATFEEYFDKEIDYTLKLDIDMKGMMMPEMEHPEDTIEWEDTMPMMNAMHGAGMIEWFIEGPNGERNMNFSMEARVGDKVKIRLENVEESEHPMQHPIHLHGQRFLVLSIDDKPVENKVWKDTVLVPIGESAEILVDVTNPGEWMMHCHIAEHLEAGMMTSFIVTE